MTSNITPETERRLDRIRIHTTVQYIADRLINYSEPIDVPTSLRNLAKRLEDAADAYETEHGPGTEGPHTEVRHHTTEETPNHG
ncbi:hypothetical protein [Nonomuraea sp. NPDC049141]|uniref:hypothetical protein n=1 Tax=Nonomuraea sp. NPDC049141 TaxID=3155500 RepID=UPI003405E4BE